MEKVGKRKEILMLGREKKLGGGWRSNIAEGGEKGE